MPDLIRQPATKNDLRVRRWTPHHVQSDGLGVLREKPLLASKSHRHPWVCASAPEDLLADAAVRGPGEWILTRASAPARMTAYRVIPYGHAGPDPAPSNERRRLCASLNPASRAARRIGCVARKTTIGIEVAPSSLGVRQHTRGSTRRCCGPRSRRVDPRPRFRAGKDDSLKSRSLWSCRT